MAQNFRWIKISPNAHTVYWHKNFAEFNFAHSAGCSPGSSGWSSRMNTPRPGPNIEYRFRTRTVRTILGTIDLSLLSFLGLSLLHAIHSSVASAMTEGYRSDEGSRRIGQTRGAMWKYRDSSGDIKLGCRSRKKRL